MNSKKFSSVSLQAFIEQTAAWLRKKSKKRPSIPKKRKKNTLSTANKIEQIARLLRGKIRKRKKQKNPFKD